MRIDILTVFTEAFQGPFNFSIIRRACEKGLVDIEIHNLRDFTTDRWRTVDDYPYGGGAGMVLKPAPIVAAIKHVRKISESQDKVVYLTPQGQILNQSIANKLSLENHLILLCGHYKGIDERIVQKYVDYEVSIGDYVLSGGEIAAIVLVDAIVRLLPGVLHDSSSALEDSFQSGLLDSPCYTRPPEFEEMRVPEVLLSGNHAQIKAWREAEALRRTIERRPDLVEKLAREKIEEEI